MKRTNSLKILLYDKVAQDETRNLNSTLLTENYVEWPDPPSMAPEPRVCQPSLIFTTSKTEACVRLLESFCKASGCSSAWRWDSLDRSKSERVNVSLPISGNLREWLSSLNLKVKTASFRVFTVSEDKLYRAPCLLLIVLKQTMKSASPNILSQVRVALWGVFVSSFIFMSPKDK